jgi:hypothetical protein
MSTNKLDGTARKSAIPAITIRIPMPKNTKPPAEPATRSASN